MSPFFVIKILETPPIVWNFCRDCNEIYPIPDSRSVAVCRSCLSHRRAALVKKQNAMEYTRSMYWTDPSRHQRAAYNGPANEMSPFQERAYRMWEDERAEA